jgi:hypothetical protein
MAAAPGADERRIRQLLRRRGVGPDAVPPPAVEIHLVPARDPQEPAGEGDWLDHLYADEQDNAEPEEPGTPWWSLRRPAPAPAAPPEVSQPAPGIHLTINQPGTPAPDDDARARARRARIRRWFAYHGAAAAVGWTAGLGPAMTDLLASSGHAAPAVGIGLIGIAAIPALYAPTLPLIPLPLRPATVWLARIPAATAALALALNAPGALT